MKFVVIGGDAAGMSGASRGKRNQSVISIDSICVDLFKFEFFLSLFMQRKYFLSQYL